MLSIWLETAANLALAGLAGVALVFLIALGLHRTATGQWYFLKRQTAVGIARRALAREKEAARLSSEIIAQTTAFWETANREALQWRETAAALQQMAYVIADEVGFPHTEHERLRRILQKIRPSLDAALREDLEREPRGALHLDVAAVALERCGDGGCVRPRGHRGAHQNVVVPSLGEWNQ